MKFFKGQKLPPRSKEWCRKISEALTGKRLSEKHKRKLSESHKGKTPWKGKKHSEEARKKMSKAHKGKKHSKETRKKLREANLGEKSYLWKGGISPINDRIRAGIEFRLWRESVFARDNFTCQKCGNKTGGNLNSHHIFNFAQFPELRFAIDNGITFCEKCHTKFHKKYGIKNNTREQLNEFIK